MTNFRCLQDADSITKRLHFLRYLKYAAQGQRIIIPTKYVYFYIEKIPLDYTVSYADSGQSISRTGAAKTLPSSAGINPYKGENRWDCHVQNVLLGGAV